MKDKIQSQSAFVGIGSLVAGVIALVASFYLYKSGVGTADYTAFKQGFLAVFVGLTLVGLGLSATIVPDAKYWIPRVLGLVIAGGAIMQFLQLYPEGWDEQQSMESIKVMLAFAGSAVLMLGPAYWKLIKERFHGTKRHIAGIGLSALSVVLLAGALALYANAISQPGLNFDMRYWTIFVTIFGTMTFFSGLTLLLPTGRGSAAFGIAGSVAVLIFIAILQFAYPQFFHDTMAPQTSFFTTYYVRLAGFGIFASVLGLLGGAVSAAQINLDRAGSTRAETVRRIQELGYNFEEGRPRAPARLFIWLPIGIGVSTIWGATTTNYLFPPIAKALGVSFFGEGYPGLMSSLDGLYQLGNYIATYGLPAALAAVFIDRRSAKSLIGENDLEGGWMKFGIVGLVVGAVAGAVTVGTLQVLGYVSLTFSPDYSIGFVAELIAIIVATTVIAYALVYAFSSWWVRNVAEGLRSYTGERAAVVIGVVSSGFPYAWFVLNQTGFVFWDSTVFLLWMVFFGAVSFTVAVTNRTSMATGMLTGWMVTLMLIFGVTFEWAWRKSLFTAEITGPEIYTGGSMGPVAGIVGVTVILTAVLIAYDLTRLASDEFSLDIQLSPHATAPDDEE